MNRCDHQVSPISPRRLRARMPSAGSGRVAGGYQPYEELGGLDLLRLGARRPAIACLCLRDCVDRQRHQVPELGRGELGQPAFAGAHDALGELALVLDHLVDALLERAHAH